MSTPGSGPRPDQGQPHWGTPPGYPPPGQPPPGRPPQGYPPQPGYPPPGYGPHRRAKNNWRGALIAIGVAVVVLAAFIGFRVYKTKQDEQIRPSDRKIYALAKGQCFVPSGTGTDDDAIRQLGSCTDPEASMRVTSIVTAYGSCPEGNGNGFLAATRKNGLYGDRSACLSTNLFIGRCYEQDDSPTLFGLVDCRDARNDNADYEVVTGRKYGTTADDACGPAPMKTYVQQDREGVICTRLY